MEFDFTTNQTLEALDDVPEQFRGAYSQGEDGKFVISDTAKGLTEAVAGLTRSLSASRREAKELKGKAIDPKSIISQIGEFEDADAVKAKLEELSQQVAEKANIDPAKLRADIERQFAAKEQEFAAKNDKMYGSLEKYMVKAAAAQALAASKGNADLLMPHVQNRVKVVEDGDDYVVRVLDEAGDYRGDGKGGYMSVEDLVSEMKASPTFAGAFESEAKPGIGAPPKGAAQPRRKTDDGDVTSRSKIAAGLAARRGRR